MGGHLNYWLKTLYLDPANAYRLHLNLEDLYVNHDYPRFYGFSLRCLSSLPRPSGRGRKSIVKQKTTILLIGPTFIPVIASDSLKVFGICRKSQQKKRHILVLQLK